MASPLFLQGRKLFSFLHIVPAEKGSTLIGMTAMNVPNDSKFFAFRVNPCSEGSQKQVDRPTSPETEIVPIIH